MMCSEMIEMCLRLILRYLYLYPKQLGSVKSFFIDYKVCTCSVKISCVKIVFILLRELGLMAICSKLNIGKKKNINNGRFTVSENNPQATVLVFCNSLLSYFIRKILHGRRNVELRGLP